MFASLLYIYRVHFPAPEGGLEMFPAAVDETPMSLFPSYPLSADEPQSDQCLEHGFLLSHRDREIAVLFSFNFRNSAVEI